MKVRKRQAQERQVNFLHRTWQLNRITNSMFLSIRLDPGGAQIPWPRLWCAPVTSGKIPNQIRQITKTTNHNYRPKYLWIFETPIHCSANHFHSRNPIKSRPEFVNSTLKAKTSLVRLRFKCIDKWLTCYLNQKPSNLRNMN